MVLDSGLVAHGCMSQNGVLAARWNCCSLSMDTGQFGVTWLGQWIHSVRYEC